MTAVPIVASVSVLYRPVAAQADENVLAKVVRINIPQRPGGAPVIADSEVESRPDYPVAYTVVPVSIHMHVMVPGFC